MSQIKYVLQNRKNMASSKTLVTLAFSKNI